MIFVSCYSYVYCILISLIIIALLTHDCILSQDNAIITFADSSAVVGLINGGDESAYTKEMESLVVWMTTTVSRSQ